MSRKSIYRVQIWVPSNRRKRTVMKKTMYGRLVEARQTGTLVEVFSISAMAEAMDRRPRTLFRWEKEAGFPKHYVIIGTDNKRWYTRRQVEGVNQIWLQQWAVTRGERRLDRDELIAAIKPAFYKDYFLFYPKPKETTDE